MAERLNRTLQDKCRTMMIAAKVPGYLWGEVFEAANTLRNITPVSNMACTPIEKWTDQKPDLSKLRIIASKAFCQIQKSQRSGKFEPVDYMGALVNYNNSSNAYRVWNPANAKVFNVGFPAFDEDATPGWWRLPGADEGDTNVAFLDLLTYTVPERRRH